MWVGFGWVWVVRVRGGCGCGEGVWGVGVGGEWWVRVWGVGYGASTVRTRGGPDRRGVGDDVLPGRDV